MDRSRKEKQQIITFMAEYGVCYLDKSIKKVKFLLHKYLIILDYNSPERLFGFCVQ